MNESLSNHIEAIISHIAHVRENTEKLGKAFLKRKETVLGLGLIKLGLIHDASKLTGIELDWLHPEYYGMEAFELALQHHVTTNKHHPEYWGSIHNMPKLYQAEMVCDWLARSSEVGTDINSFIRDVGTKKFNFSLSEEDQTYCWIKQ